MATGKPRVYSYVPVEVKNRAIAVLRGGETLSDLVEIALRAEIERRESGASVTSTTEAPTRLPPGRRPKPK